MKKFAMFGVFALVLAATLSGSPAEAEVRVQFVNKTDRTVFLAVGTDVVSFVAEGWFRIAPGKSYEYKREIIPAGGLNGFVGYYAFARKEGAKTVYWNGDWKRGMIHPTQKFLIGEEDGEFPEGAVEVGFRSLKSGKVNGDVETATVTFTLK